MTQKEYKEALHLAGKLAVQVQYLIKSSALDVSDCLVRVQKALSEYDNYIFSHISNGE